MVYDEDRNGLSQVDLLGIEKVVCGKWGGWSKKWNGEVGLHGVSYLIVQDNKLWRPVGRYRSFGHRVLGADPDFITESGKFYDAWKAFKKDRGVDDE